MAEEGGGEDAEQAEGGEGAGRECPARLGEAGQEEGRQDREREGPGEPGQAIGQGRAAGRGGGHSAAVDGDFDDERAEQHDADADGDEAADQEGAGVEPPEVEARSEAGRGGPLERGGGHGGVSQWRAYSSAR